MKKQCVMCGELKQASDFYKEKRVKDGLTARCRLCTKTAASSSYEQRKEDVLKRQKEKYCAQKSRAQSLKINYGMTVEQWNELFAKQNYCCAICGTTEPNHASGNFVVDHCHSLNHVRGILCGSCNLMLGNAKDDANTLFDAAMYLIGRSVGESIEENRVRLGLRPRVVL